MQARGKYYVVKGTRHTLGTKTLIFSGAQGAKILSEVMYNMNVCVQKHAKCFFLCWSVCTISFGSHVQC